MTLLRNAVVSVAVLSFALTALAERHERSGKGFRAEMIVQMKSIQEKLVGLATETPEDKFSWRPAEGVRSTGEVFVHAAAANYFLLSMTGVALPEGLDPRSMEKEITKKDEIIKALDDSYSFLYAELEKMSDEDLEKMIKLFGRDASVRLAMMLTIEHNSEHLGQSIAYARMNGITPPWSRKAE
jgi:uncharacterized damage-inducible protein DinB